jgi:hypothetical protein
VVYGISTGKISAGKVYGISAGGISVDKGPKWLELSLAVLNKQLCLASEPKEPL